MKTAEQKAEYWLNDNVAGWTDAQLRALTVLLKDQEIDTLRSCIEMIDRRYYAYINARSV